MAEKIILEVDVKGNAAESINKTVEATKTLKAQLREMVLELQTLEPGSKRFNELTQAAGKLKDTIADTNAVINATAGAPIANLGKGLQNVASIGIGAFQGIMSAQALFGAQSEDLQKMLVKLQAAAGLSAAINSLGDLGDQITNIKASFGAFVTSAKAGLAGIKGAVAATGIGLLVIAVGLLVTYWSDIKGAVTGVSVEQKKLNELSKAQVVSEQKKLDSLNGQDNTLRLQGKTEREILQLKIAQIGAVIKAMEVSMENDKKTFEAQYAAEKRNREILKGLLTFVQAPLLLLLKTIDTIAAFVGKDTGLAKGLLDFESSFLFDEAEVKKNFDKTAAENKILLDKLKNDRDGLILETQKIDKGAQEDRKRNAEKALADGKANDADRLAAKRELEDATLDLMDEGMAKELEANRLKFNRLIEDTTSNEKRTTAEKKAINEAYEKERLQAIEAINLAEALRLEEARLEAIKKDKQTAETLFQNQKVLQDRKIALMEKGVDKEKAIREAAFRDEIHSLQKQLEDKTIEQADFDALIVLMTDKKTADIAAIEKAADDKLRAKKIAGIQDTIAGLQEVLDFGSEAINVAVNGALGGIGRFLTVMETEFEEGLKGTMEKISAYTQVVGEVLSSFVDAFVEKSQETLDATIDNIGTQTQNEKDSLKARYDSGLASKEEYDAGIIALDQGAKAQEEAARKKQFEQEKKGKIASATIAGIQGAVQAFAGAMSLGPIAGPIVGAILAASVAGATAMNIAKIKATQYESAGGAGGGAAAGGGTPLGADSVAGAPTPPSLTMGGALGGSEGSGLQLFGERQTGSNRSYVVESDITGTQNRLMSYQQRAEIG